MSVWGGSGSRQQGTVLWAWKRALGDLLCSVAVPSPNWLGGMVVQPTVWALCLPALSRDSVMPSVHSVDPISAQSVCTSAA